VIGCTIYEDSFGETSAWVGLVESSKLTTVP
jgi:hypothetical protein